MPLPTTKLDGMRPWS